jgi:hypothetical protein
VAAPAVLALIEPVTAAVHFRDMDVMGEAGRAVGRTPVHSSNGTFEVRRRWYCLERVARLTSGAIAANASCKSDG